MSQLEHYDDEIFALEERISRLAIACRIDLTDSVQLAAVRQGEHTRVASGSQRSVHLLRQLLNLKDYVTVHCIEDHGVDECRQIMDEIEARLRQNGFRR